MENDDGIKGYIKWENEEKCIKGIKHAILRVGKERLAGELIGIPQRETSMLNAFDPEESRGDEIRTQIPFCEQKPFLKEIIKEEQRQKEKGQTS